MFVVYRIIIKAFKKFKLDSKDLEMNLYDVSIIWENIICKTRSSEVFHPTYSSHLKSSLSTDG